MKAFAFFALLTVASQLPALEPKGAWFTCDFEQSNWQTRWNMGNPSLPRNLAIVPHRTTGPDAPPPMSGTDKLSAGNALAITLKQGGHYGADFGFGFARQEEGSRICSVSRDGCALMLSQRDTIAEPALVWIGCENESLFEDWRSSRAKVRQEPRNCPWAYEMKFEDLDGNVLWLGTEPRRDEPFETPKPS